MPPKGALARATLGAAAGWDDQTELLAAAVDGLGQIEYVLRAAPHFKGSPELPRPVPRPGDDPDADGEVNEGEALPTTLEDAGAYFRAHRTDE